MVHTITVENAGFELALVHPPRSSRSAGPRSSNHRQRANCTARHDDLSLLLRRVATRSVLPRERFSPLTHSSYWLQQNRLPIAAGDAYSECSFRGSRSRKKRHERLRSRRLSLVSTASGGLTVLRLTAVGHGSVGSSARRSLVGVAT